MVFMRLWKELKYKLSIQFFLIFWFYARKAIK